MEADSSSSRWLTLSEDVLNFSVPSPAVVRSSRPHSNVLQRRTERINSSLRTLDTVLTGTPVTTPITSQLRASLPRSAAIERTLELENTPQRSPRTVSIMNESGLLRDVLVPTPAHEALPTLLSPREEQQSFHLSFQKDTSPLLKLSQTTYLDHPMLQVGLELMTTFHHHLLEKHSPSQLLELLEGFEHTCAFQIEHLKTLDNSNHIKDVLIELQLEHDTWQLARGLYSDRLSQDTEEDEDITERELVARTDKEVIEDYYMSNEWVRQAQIVIDWLEKIATSNLDNFPAKVNYFTGSVSWESTLHDIQHGLNVGRIVTELDPDAPSRQKKHLSELDEKDETSLSRHLFECVRAGDIDKASELCMNCGQSWRAATLDGWKLYNDSNLTKDVGDELEEIEGNLGRSLWKFSCWELAKCPSYNDHEKAIYAALSGNIAYLLPVCQTWYDYVWAYFKVMVDVLVEQKLLSSKRYPMEESLDVKLPQEYWKAILVPEVVFQEIEAIPSQRIRRQCVDYYHLSQKHLILGSLDALVDEMHGWLDDTLQTNSHLLRFMAHLTLFIQTVGTSHDENKCYDILETFIKMLISHKLNDLVALYCSYLPHDRHVTAYCALLTGVTESNEQRKCLELAKECSLDVVAITKEIVVSTRQTETEAISSSSHLEQAAYDLGITEKDQKKIDMLDWLLFEESHREEAICQSNALIREFLALNKYRAAAEAFQKIPTDSVAIVNQNWTQKNGSTPLSPRLVSNIHEHISIKAYLKAIQAFNLWFEHYHHSRPATPPEEQTKNFMEYVAYERQVDKHKRDLAQWEEESRLLMNEFDAHAFNVLLFVKGGWMKHNTEKEGGEEEWGADDELRIKQMKRLRQLCIPRLTFLLHSVFHSTGNFKKCAKLADVIVSDNKCLYEEFQQEELKHLLKLIHQSSLESTDTLGLDPFGYSLT